MRNPSRAQNFSGRIGDGEAQVFQPSIASQTFRALENQNQNRLYGEIVQKRRERRDAMSINVDLDGFVRDVNGELQNAKQELRAFTRETLREKGINDESLTMIEEQKQKLRQKVNMSMGQKSFVAQVKKKLQGVNADKHYDIEATQKNIDEFIQAGIEGRAVWDKPLLVRKPEEFSLVEDIPKNLLSPNFRTMGKQYGEMFAMTIAQTPEGRNWYEQGKLLNQWDNPDQARNFAERINALKYKLNTGGSETVKTNPYGDLSQSEAAMKRIRAGENNEPAVRTMTFGQNQYNISAITEFFPKKNEAYGEITYMRPNGEIETGVVDKFMAQQYFQIVDGNRQGQKMLMGTWDHYTQKQPDQFTDTEAQLYLGEDDALKAEYADLIDGGFTEAQAKEIVFPKAKKKLSEESRDRKRETIYIMLDEDMEDEQKRMRPNMYSAFQSAIQDFSFSNTDASTDYQQWKSKIKTESEPDTVINGKSLDKSIISSLLGND